VLLSEAMTLRSRVSRCHLRAMYLKLFILAKDYTQELNHHSYHKEQVRVYINNIVCLNLPPRNCRKNWIFVSAQRSRNAGPT
jgi:hypothetical protein